MFRQECSEWIGLKSFILKEQVKCENNILHSAKQMKKRLLNQ